MACHSCGVSRTSLVEGFQCPLQKQKAAAPDNRCPKTFPAQTCIYTTQGLLMCNSKGNEIPDVETDIELNIYQPFYHQTLERSLQQQ